MRILDVNAAPPGPELWPEIEAMMAAVARLHSIDPLTAELVRLQGARFHHCRLCSSRRRVSAVMTNADILEDTDLLARSDLSDTQRAALELTDAILLHPAEISPQVTDAVRRTLTPEQAIEIAFLVAHNAANKIAVALGADAPAVVDGFEYFEISASGDYDYELPAPS